MNNICTDILLEIAKHARKNMFGLLLTNHYFYHQRFACATCIHKCWQCLTHALCMYRHGIRMIKPLYNLKYANTFYIPYFRTHLHTLILYYDHADDMNKASKILNCACRGKLNTLHLHFRIQSTTCDTNLQIKHLVLTNCSMIFRGPLKSLKYEASTLHWQFGEDLMCLTHLELTFDKSQKIQFERMPNLTHLTINGFLYGSNQYLPKPLIYLKTFALAWLLNPWPTSLRTLKVMKQLLPDRMPLPNTLTHLNVQNEIICFQLPSLLRYLTCYNLRVWPM